MPEPRYDKGHPMSVIVETVYGKLAGEERGGITSFLGVPFAAPPFGPRRFRPPARPARWDGTRPANQRGLIVPQPTPAALVEADMYRPSMDSDGGQQHGEDCLNLNVWTPDPGGGGLPVMVFLHGGGQVVGTGSDPWYDGTHLAREGVVVVTTNRRLGAEGYLYLRDWFDDERSTGNFGLLDVIESLRWVQENIAAFGGDPGNVTLFGESGGGIATTAVLSMDASRGLLHRAIAQSAVDGVNAPEAAARASRKLLELVGVAPGDWDGLVATPWRKFVDVFPKTLQIDEESGLEPYIPTLGELLPERPSEAIPAGAARDVSLLIGTNLDEEKLMERIVPMQGAGLANLSLAGVQKQLGAAGIRLDDVLDAYDRARPGLSRDELATALIGDFTFRIPSLKIADGHSRHSPGRTFMYLFSWASPNLGAAHALDLAPLFGNYDNRYNELAGDAPHEKLDRAMRRAWSAFARTGDPSTQELPWPSYGTTTRRTMQLDETCRVLEDPYALQREALAKLP